MKQTKKIWISLLIYIIAMIATVSGVMYYIELKQHRLWKDITANFDELFDGKSKIVDIEYSNSRVEYSKMAFPNKKRIIKKALEVHKLSAYQYQNELAKTISDTYDKELGDLNNLYQLKYESSFDSPFRANGWRLFVLERKGTYFAWFNYMFPYAVGYKKSYFGHTPSVPDAVSEAFDFYTNNKSDIASCIRKGFYTRFRDILREAENEYYYFKLEEGNPILSWMHQPLFFDYPDQGTPYFYRNGYMYNSFYKVFVGMTPPYVVSIGEIPGNKKKNTIRLIAICGTTLTLLLLIFILPLLREIAKNKKIKKESLYERLLRLSNPSNFIDNYNKEKVDLANSLHNRLLNISLSDNDSLMVIIDEIERGLGVCIVDNVTLSDLKKKVNPKNFISPYDAEKVSLANDLYSRLTKDNLSYKDIIEIEKESYKL